jgi:hypothetical protein
MYLNRSADFSPRVPEAGKIRGMNSALRLNLGCTDPPFFTFN